MAEKLTPERVFADPALGGPTARGVKLSPDGSMVTFLRAKADDQRVTDLWGADVKGGAPRLLVDGRALIPVGRTLSEAEKARRERAGVQSRGVVGYDWDEQGRVVLVPVEGDLWLWERATGTPRQLTSSAEDEIDAKVSPKGDFVSFVRADNLYVQPLQGGVARALTQGGSGDRSWATAEFIAEEELDRRTGYWWSPDDTRIAVAHVDQTGVDIVPRPDIGATGATIVQQRYPRAGRPNALVDLWVIGLDGKRVQVDLGPSKDIYLARVDWAKDGRTLYVQRLSRDQKRLDLLAIDPVTGKGSSILTETSPHWVDVTDDFKPLADGRFLWSSERSGTRQLYLHDHAGKQIQQLTDGAEPVRALEGIDEAQGTALFLAGGDPTEQRLYAVSITGGNATPLTAAGGWWTATVAEKGGAFAGTYGDPATPPRTGLYDRSGKLVRWIEENQLTSGHPWWPYHDRFPAPRYGTVAASDGQALHYVLQLPPGFDPARRYPVIVRPYGGPGSALVKRDWIAPSDRLYLEAGYLLFTLDNRGTPNRPVSFKSVNDRRLSVVEVEDQLAGVTWLKAQPFVAGDRIGVTGWSYGGYLTLLLLTAPDSPFAAGVAGAPPTDWALYDTAYTERYMGTPAENPTGYKAAEIVSRLNRLRPDSLLLIHGMADDNVTFDNSTRIMAALQEKSIPFETMLYPGLRHRAGWGQAQLLHRTRATLDFFARKLHPEAAK